MIRKWQQITKDGHLIKNQAEIISLTSEEKKQEPFSKRILIVDNEPDITQTFKSALEQEYNNNKNLKYTHLTTLY